jgi:hypothetical protein
MACKRSAVRFRLAPPLIPTTVSNSRYLSYNPAFAGELRGLSTIYGLSFCLFRRLGAEFCALSQASPNSFPVLRARVYETRLSLI